MMYRWLLGIALLAAIVGGSARWHGKQKQAAYDAGYATCDAAVAREAFTTTEKVRAKEISLTDKNTKATNDYKAENARLRAEFDDTRRLLDNLQVSASSANSPDSATSAGVIDPYPSALVECANALTEVDEEYQRVRGMAQALQRYASEVCVSDIK